MKEPYVPRWLPVENIPCEISLADDRLIIHSRIGRTEVDGGSVGLSYLQYEILLACALKSDEVVSYKQLARDIWVTEATDPNFRNSLKVRKSELLRQLPRDLGDAETGVLRVQHGIGYYAVSSLSFVI